MTEPPSAAHNGPTRFSSGAGHVISFASAKGGTGKTVLAASTALALLSSGKRVLVIDGDFSTRGLSLFILGSILSTSDLLVRDEECLAEFFLSDATIEDLRPRRIDRGGVEYHILFSNKTLWQSGVPEQAILSDSRIDAKHFIEGIHKILDHFRKEYDYIIIDTRGGYDFTSAVPALLSDTNIIVLEPDRVSLEQISGYDKAMREFAAFHKIRVPLRGFIVNKASFDPNQTRFVEELTKTYAIKTYGVIPADINCIRAYETTDSPVTRFPYSDFAYWFMRALEAFIAPEINWPDRESIKRLANLRTNITKSWAGRKRLDLVITWLPFAQLIPISGASVFYIAYRYSPSSTLLYTIYSLVVVFIIWSMIGSSLSGLEWLRSREFSAQTRRAVLTTALSAVLTAAAILAFDVPKRIFRLGLPPNAYLVARATSDGISVLQQQAVHVVQAWLQLALNTIERSESKIYTDAEAFVRTARGVTAIDELPEEEKRAVATLTRQIIDEARSRVRGAADKVTNAVNNTGSGAQLAADAIIRILENPKATVDDRNRMLAPVEPPERSREVQFPSVSDVLAEATKSILTRGSAVADPVTYFVCVGEFKSACGPAATWLPCGADVHAWAMSTHPQECRTMTVRTLADVAGGRCGYANLEVRCISE